MHMLGLASATLALAAASARADFQLQYTIDSPGSYTPTQLSILTTAVDHAKRMWETVLTGYQPGISVTTIPITIFAINTGLADASYTSSVQQGGYTVSTSGFIEFNRDQIEPFSNWQGPGANGLNFVDETLAHETGHVLGIGTQWVNNGLYINGTYHYTGAHGVAAYRAEFNPSASYVPVENAGSPGTPDAHWDQLMRSSTQEGNPADPWSLDPRVGITDPFGRDQALELMTGAIDPDYGEPFLSRTTVESMRDLGFTVTSFYDFNGDGLVNQADYDILTSNMGATGLQIDSIAFGDVNRDRRVDATDQQLWLAAVPEPTMAAIAMAGLVGCLSRRRRARV
jgi:hypothetical protein